MRAGYVFLAIFSIAVLAGCRKENDEEIQISGKILDKNQGTPVSGALVVLAASKVQTGIYNPSYETVATVNSSSGGDYSFNVTNDKFTGYRITVIKDQYFDMFKDYEVNSIKSGQSNTVNLEILPQAFLNLRVRNVVSPVNNQDLIGYHIVNTQPGCQNCCGNGVLTGNGSVYDTTFTCKTYGHSYVKIQWTVQKGGQNSYYLDSVFCPAFQTTPFVVNY